MRRPKKPRPLYISNDGTLTEKPKKFWLGRPPEGEEWERLPFVFRETGQGIETKFIGKNQLFVDLRDGNRIVWEIYQGPLRGLWRPIKLCARPGAILKANFSLHWTFGDGELGEARFARARDAGLLFEHRPQLYTALQSLLLSEPLESQIGL